MKNDLQKKKRKKKEIEIHKMSSPFQICKIFYEKIVLFSTD